VFDYFVDVQVFVSSTNAGQRFFRAESAAGAAADVIFAKESTLSAWEVHEQFTHRDIRIDRGIRDHSLK
jgi:hypothetical protein